MQTKMLLELQDLSEKSTEIIDRLNIDRSNFFGIYLEFILHWIISEADIYETACCETAGEEEKKLFRSLADKQIKMSQIFTLFRNNEKTEWFNTPLKNGLPGSKSRSILETKFQKINTIKEAFNFSYREEYESLNTFEKLGNSGLAEDVQKLMALAASYQRQNILFLDSKLMQAIKTATLVDFGKNETDYYITQKQSTKRLPAIFESE